MTTRERRKNARVKRRLKVQYGEGDFGTSGFGLDISLGGLFLTANKLLPIGTRMRLLTEGEDAFCIEALVVRHRLVPSHMRAVQPQGMGIRFLHPNELVEPHLRSRSSGSIPAVENRAYRIECASPRALEDLLREQLGRGVAILPVDDPPPAPGDRIEFEVRLTFLAPQRIYAAEGKVLQVLSNVVSIGGSKGAVVQVDEAENLTVVLADAR